MPPTNVSIRHVPVPPPEITVIGGCGYLGKQLGRQLMAGGHAILGLTHSQTSADDLHKQSIRSLACDVTDAAACRRAADECAGTGVAEDRKIRVIHCAASGRGGGPEQYRAVYLEGARNLRAAFPSAMFFLTSSTSVYAQIDGSEVREESTATPDRETGRILRLAEEEALAAGGIVGRLAGIYGPHRSVLLKNFLQGKSAIDIRTEPPPTPDGRWINQIHVADAARAILHLLDHPSAPGEIFNIADSTPLTQRDVYTRLGDRFSRPLPPEAPPDASRKRGWTHKRVSNAFLRSTGWEPLYPDWFAALDHDPAFLASILND